MIRCSQPNNGFSLVELLAVLVSTGVLIALLIPTPRVHGFLECSSKWLPDVDHDYVLFVPHDYDYSGKKAGSSD